MQTGYLARYAKLVSGANKGAVMPVMAEKRELTLDKIYHASYVLKDVIRKTEMIHAPELNSECEVYLKTENLQVTGSFKVRGAYYKISQLSEEEKACGVVASSAGNHAQGVALAAAKNGISSLICIPDSAPISKVEATKSYGAEVELVSGAYDDSYKRALDLVEEQGRTLIHPFDDPDVIAGQGTIGLEILDQLKDVDVVLVPHRRRRADQRRGVRPSSACSPTLRYTGCRRQARPACWKASAKRRR